MSSTLRQDSPHEKGLEGNHVLEAPRRIPVRSDVDVLVCGGGPAGTAAALAAAREGARTLLVERHGMLGGVWTAGLMNPFFEAMGRGWVVQDLVDRLRARGAFREWYFAHTFDTEAMKLVLEEMMREAGVSLLYHTLVADAVLEAGRLRGVVLESKAGREAITARVIIDATGDGDVAARAGCRYELGRPSDGLLQPMTLMFEVRGLGDWEMRDARLLYDAMAEASEREKIDFAPPFPRVKYAPWIISTPTRGSGDIQLTHVYRLNPLDPADLTRGTLDARRQAHQALEVLRHVPGLEKIEMVQTAPQIGIREGRRVRGLHWLTLAELQVGSAFPDAVASCGFVVDIHEPNRQTGITPPDPVKTRAYEIPYRCLVPGDVRGLLLAGRCISGSHEAHASYRVTGTCAATGQAAGLAAAWAARDGIDPAAVPGEKLRALLAERGARFLDSGLGMSVPAD